MNTGKTRWKKGMSGNPKGRPPVLTPGFLSMVDKDKVACKSLILQYFKMTRTEFQQRQADPSIGMFEAAVGACIDKVLAFGDMDILLKLMQVVFGKLPEDSHHFETTPEERAIVVEFRRRVAEQSQPPSIADIERVSGEPSEPIQP